VDASYRLTDHLKVYASWNTSLRMPSVTELYYSVGGHKADKYLKPEELSALEGGFKYSSRMVQGSISGFYHHCKNMIDWVMDISKAEPIWESMNYTKVNTLGLETAVHVDFRELMPTQEILKNLNISYCYMNREKDEEDERIKTQSTLEYLKHKLVATAQLHLVSQLNLGVSYRFQDRAGSYTDTHDAVHDYTPYSLVDARLSWNAAEYEVYAEANNLLNKKDYVDYGNVPQPGTWFIAGLKMNI
jgi:iron complex outermembrane receptor protein